jgi:hypothetical protein
MFDELRDAPGVAWTINYEADAARKEGDLVAAKTLNEDALAHFQRLKDDWGVASASAGLGHLARDEGDNLAACRWYGRALGINRRLGNVRAIAQLFEAFALMAAHTAEHDRVLKLAGAAAALRHSIGARRPPFERDEVERMVASARTSPNAAEAWMEGWSMSVDEAARYATEQAG